jgi:cytochrome c peroxidase
MSPRFAPLLALLLLFVSCTTDEDQRLVETSRRVFGPLPDQRQDGDTRALVKLGEHLYFSNELSINRTQSCNSCHPIDTAGVDRLPTSRGALGQPGRRNTPSVFNASLHLAQFWDGRAGTLEEQAAGPIVNPVEMAMPNAEAVAERLRNSAAIDRELFRAAFPDDPQPLTLEHAAKAIAAFERTLQTEDRFDEFMKGDADALTAQEKEGLRRFMSLGCTSCHNGPLVGARIYQRIGIVNAWPNADDRGRYEVTKLPSDDQVFKVPALRNVANTAPYFHDGSVAKLDNAVERMAWHQLGTEISKKDRDAIVAFLHALTDVRNRGLKSRG